MESVCSILHMDKSNTCLRSRPLGPRYFCLWAILRGSPTEKNIAVPGVCYGGKSNTVRYQTFHYIWMYLVNGFFVCTCTSKINFHFAVTL